MPQPPMPGNQTTTSKAENYLPRQADMTGTVLWAIAGVALAAILYLVTFTVDSDLNTGDRIAFSVLSFALAFLLTAAVGLRGQLNAARSTFLESVINLLSTASNGGSINGVLPAGEDRPLQSLASWAASLGNIRGLSRTDFERLTAMISQVSIMNVGRLSNSSISGDLRDEAVPNELDQAGMDAYGLLDRYEYDEASAKLTALYDLAVDELGPLHQFTLRIRANIAYLHVSTGELATAKNELQNLLRDQIRKYNPDNSDLAWTMQLLAEINES